MFLASNCFKAWFASSFLIQRAYERPASLVSLLVPRGENPAPTKPKRKIRNQHKIIGHNKKRIKKLSH